MATSRFHLLLALIAGLGVAIYLLGNGATSLWDRDEPRFAEAAREMVATGDYLVPRFHGAVRYDKPPLIYWLMAAAYRVTGPTPLGARLPSALAGGIAVFLTGLLGRRLVGAAAGLWGALILALCLQLTVEAKVATVDATLLATICAGMVAVVRSWQGEGGWGNLLFGWGAVALAILTKGPIAPLVVGGTALGLKLAGGRPWPWPGRRLAAGLVILLAICLPWVVAVQAATDGDFLRVAIGHHVIDRAAHPLEGHRGPIWYYLATLPASFFPWALLGFGALFDLIRRAREAASRPLLLWLAIPFALFTATATKLPHYTLPAYPALALALGRIVAAPRRPPWWGWLAAASGLFALALGIGLAVGAQRQLPGGAPVAVGMEALLLLLVGVAHLTFRWRYHAVAVATTAAAALLCLGGATLPALEPFKPSPPMVAALEAAPPAARYSYGYFEPSLVFASHDTVQEVSDRAALIALLASPTSFACVLPRTVWHELAPALTSPPAVLAAFRGFNVARGHWGDWVVVGRLAPPAPEVARGGRSRPELRRRAGG
ncbi:MAG: hypothetical protein AUK30_05720 [Nitrospirae bacterium CG2_30_70_394]|nr:glycosyltransferase family 39 protein [Deltaproteobacteria bacterium]NCP95334.1 glycosyltransferase family 39 protein [Deltaproteobacteria bacterium]OIP64903.1 MAG: hypothetical protein AUK30_05720 [Nitrospirae bacterium CG2_30_70_394]